jgi:hypothetical protein
LIFTRNNKSHLDKRYVMEKTLKPDAHACTMQPLAVREPVSSVQRSATPPPFEDFPRGAASAVNLCPGGDHSDKSTSDTGTPLRSTIDVQKNTLSHVTLPKDIGTM